MPKINQFISTKSLAVDRSTGSNIASKLQTELAVAGAQKSLAQGIGQFGGGIARYTQSRDRINKNLAGNRAKNAAREQAILSLNEAVSGGEVLPDGSNTLEVYENTFNDVKEDFLEGVADEDVAISEIMFDSARVQNLSKVLSAQRQKHADFVLTMSEKEKKNYNLSSHQDPDLFEQNSVDLGLHYTVLAEEGIITPSQSKSLSESAVKENALSAVNGMTQINRDFDKAIERVTTGDMSKVFSETERSKLIETIQNRKMRSIFIKTKKAITPAEQDAVETEMERMVSRGQMKKADQTFLVKMMDEDIVENDDSQAFDLESRLASGEDPKTVLEDVKLSVNGETLKASTGRQVLNDITTVLARQSSGNKTLSNKRISLGTKRIDAVYGSKELLDSLGLNGKEKAVLKNDVLIRYYELLRNQPSADPVDMSNQAIREFGQSSAILPSVPGVSLLEQKNSSGLANAARTLKIRFRQGQIDKREYNRRLLLIKERLDALKLEEEIVQTAKEQAIKRQERRDK